MSSCVCLCVRVLNRLIVIRVGPVRAPIVVSASVPGGAPQVARILLHFRG